MEAFGIAEGFSQLVQGPQEKMGDGIGGPSHLLGDDLDGKSVDAGEKNHRAVLGT
jgi:hypothetical protein